MMAQEQNPAFFRLPAELRNRIYFDALVEDTATFHLSRDHMIAPLLEASRQIREEASGIFYSNNTFQFNQPNDCIKFMLGLTHKQRDLVHELRYDCSEVCEDPKAWRLAFQDLPGLDEDGKLAKLKAKLVEHGIFLGGDVLKAGIRINGRLVWATDPLSEARDAVQDGCLVGRVMFV
jgi:hypothetical protein